MLTGRLVRRKGESQPGVSGWGRLHRVDISFWRWWVTLGARAAGIEVAACIENDPNAVATYSHNITDVVVHSEDIESWNAYPKTT